eukprot:TRINITY_DN6052_c0_g1_i2.p1 TRINITY_DN6052_c0_g1~~TRINITY_DN6052_c0_g1_i2.p1  ORF type:complete len:167 (+),score=29.36 TRINITY_DN6052_c0_g1_i2:192-692(+)
MAAAEHQTPVASPQPEEPGSPGSPKALFVDKSAVDTIEPTTCEVIFTDDLPHGPYGEKAGDGCKVFLKTPKSYEGHTAWSMSSTYQAVGEVMLDTFISTRSSSPKGKKAVDWRIVDIKFKGGVCDQTDTAQEGTHSITFGRKAAPGEHTEAPPPKEQHSKNCCVVC